MKTHIHHAREFYSFPSQTLIFPRYRSSHARPSRPTAYRGQRPLYAVDGKYFNIPYKETVSQNVCVFCHKLTKIGIHKFVIISGLIPTFQSLCRC